MSKLSKEWFYDVEIFKNFFSVIFINLSVDPRVIDLYIKADINNDEVLKRKCLDAIPHYKIIIDAHRNDYSFLIEFLSSYKILIGYNSINYDDLIIDYLIINHRRYNANLKHKKSGNHLNEDLYNLSQDAIMYGRGFRYENDMFRFYKPPYDSIDLQKLLYLDKSFVSLKQVAIQLKWYRIQDLPLPYHEPVEYGIRHSIIDYNFNDVFITWKLYINQINEVNLRILISNLYKVNVKTQSRSGTASKLLAKFYADASGLDYKDFINLRTYRRVIKFDDIIYPNITFQTDKLSKFLTDMKSTALSIGIDKFKPAVIFNNKKYKFGIGGLHSSDEPRVYTSSDKVTYRDCDATSYYPYGIINNKVAPKHLDTDMFINMSKGLVDERVEAKATLNKIKKLLESDSPEAIEKHDTILKVKDIYYTKADGLKIVINSGLFGKLGDENSFLYDLKAMYEVTVNNQLYLMMLIEMLYLKGINNISANTDGIICEIPVELEDVYYETCKDWEAITDFNLEYTDYHKYVCYAINDYMAISPGYTNSNKSDDDKGLYIKLKGLFSDAIKIDKGYKHPVVAKALILYYADGIPVETTIRNHTDIYDFLISVKTGQDFIKEYHYVIKGELKVEELQKNVRYYISNGGGVIIKRYKNPKKNKKGIIIETIALHKGVYSTIFNDYFDVDNFKDYNINYNYYIKEAYKIINEINNVVSNKLKNRNYGGLFDD